jgi:phage/plasmid-like protein (TIGR03299 family)
MSHEITIRANGRAEMAYVGEVPWHGLGQAMPAGQPLEVWATAAGMDWEIARAAVRYPVRPEDASNPDAWRRMDDRHVLLRSDTGDALGVVSDRYQEVQPREVLGFFRELTEEAGFTLETAGTLYGGKRFWALARVAKDATIRDAKDKVGGFLLLSTSADGSLATEARFTTVRVVCRNTLGVALREKSREVVRVSHRSVWDADAAKRDLGLATREAVATFEEAMDSFRRLAATPLAPGAADSLTMRLLSGDPAEMTAKEKEEARKDRTFRAISDLAAGRGLIGGDMAGGAGTAWGWLNAVTQHVDHAARARSAENRLNSAWFGDGAIMKRTARDLALALV